MKSVCEIIAIENGSTDETHSVLTDLRREFHEKLVVIESPRGLGNALKYGAEISKGEIIVFIADDMPFGSTEMSFISKNIIDDSTLYVSSKYYRWPTLNRSVLRLGMSLCFILLRELILRTKVRDSQGGFFGKTELIKGLLHRSSEQGFLVTTELVHMSRRLGLSIMEVPVPRIEEAKRKTTIRPYDVLQMFTGLFRVRNRYRSL
jgi:dolichyl-phosphate beta-glucosyltransferase